MILLSWELWWWSVWRGKELLQSAGTEQCHLRTFSFSVCVDVFDIILVWVSLRQQAGVLCWMCELSDVISYWKVLNRRRKEMAESSSEQQREGSRSNIDTAPSSCKLHSSLTNDWNVSFHLRMILTMILSLSMRSKENQIIDCWMKCCSPSQCRIESRTIHVKVKRATV